MENLGVCYGGVKLSIDSLIYKMMRVIESKLKDDGGIDIRDSASADLLVLLRTSGCTLSSSRRVTKMRWNKRRDKILFTMWQISNRTSFELILFLMARLAFVWL